jgi:segregation and condensation protein A
VSSPLNVHLEEYEGPLDLLLDLIRKQKIDIHDIPIAKITAQYLEYMEKAAELNIEISAEFVYMAATLIHIKSKMLLPKDPALAEMDGEEDPRDELVDRLLEHEKFRNAAAMLQQKRMLEEAIWSNPAISDFVAEDDGPGLAVDLFDLVKTLQSVIDRAKNRPLYEVDQEDVSVPDMMAFLRRVLQDREKSEMVPVRELFEHQKSRKAMICLFLAILEMVKVQAVAVVQSELFGEIAIRKYKGFNDYVASEEMAAAVEEEYN